MNKYTRKQINVKTQLHGQLFVTLDDATAALVELASMAVEAGADKDKIMLYLAVGAPNEKN